VPRGGYAAKRDHDGGVVGSDQLECRSFSH